MKRKWRGENDVLRFYRGRVKREKRRTRGGLSGNCGYRQNLVASFCLKPSTCMEPMRESPDGGGDRPSRWEKGVFSSAHHLLPSCVSSSASPLMRTWLLKGDRTPDFLSPHTNDPFLSAMASRVTRQRYLLNRMWVLIISHTWFKKKIINFFLQFNFFFCNALKESVWYLWL